MNRRIDFDLLRGIGCVLRQRARSLVFIVQQLDHDLVEPIDRFWLFDQLFVGTDREVDSAIQFRPEINATLILFLSV